MTDPAADPERERAEDEAEGWKIAASPFGRHEVLHTASLAMDFFDRNVLSHPAVESGDADIAQAAQKTFDALFDFYQLCGARFAGPSEDA